MSGEDELTEQIQGLLLYEHQRLTPAGLARIIRARLPRTTRSLFRAAVNRLVSDGTLRYTNHFSTTHLEINFNRAVSVSQRIVLAPAPLDIEDERNAVVVKLAAGDAFGSGDHPTTRMALQAVDWVLAQMQRRGTLENTRALDIGTGSAVLAIAAVKLGMASAVGIDIDPVACHEARSNLRLNALTHRIGISAMPLDRMTDLKFDLLMANLRGPTLKRFFPLMQRISQPGAHWVLSGFRPEEQDGVMMALPPDTFLIRWKKTVLNWAAIVLQRDP